MNTGRLTAELHDVRVALEAWRGQRRKGDRIPAEIWRRAARAVRQYGLNPVSHALRLDYYQLKRWAGRVGARGDASREPVFVEVSPGSGAKGAGTETGLACVVELEKSNGTRMRIAVREAVTVDWAKIKEAFLGA